MATKSKNSIEHDPSNHYSVESVKKNNQPLVFIITLMALTLSTFGIIFTLHWSLTDPSQGILPYESSPSYQKTMSDYYQEVYHTYYKESTTAPLQAIPNPKGLERLKQKNGLYYCVETSSGYLFSNVPEIKLVYDFYKVSHTLIRIADSPKNSSLDHLDFLPLPPYRNQIYVGMSKAFFDTQEKLYKQTFEKQNKTFLILMLVFSTIGFSGILLTIIASFIHQPLSLPALKFYNKPYWDLYGIAVLLLVSGTLQVFDRLNFHDWIKTPPPLFNSPWPALVLISLIVTFVLGSCCLWLSTFVKRIKRREFLSGSLIGILILFAYEGIQRVIVSLKSSSSGFYTLALLIAYNIASVMILFFAAFVGAMTRSFLISGIVLLFLLCSLNLVVLVFLFDKASALQNISKGVSAILAGDLEVYIQPRGGHRLSQLALQINQMASGLENAVKKELKSERMKTELITNVSHDLKTPLTSIISYIDLLKREGLDAPSAPGYLNVLEEKAQKLKFLTEDLFEAAKASSGNLTMSLEPLDIVALVHQGLGEMSSAIEAAGLQCVLTLPEKEVLVMGDGKYMWRVIENLLSNVIKHAMPASRVYLHIDDSKALVTLTLKNMSAHPLNVSSDQLLERFVRGEESRSTEGSGLGLSIAKDLTQLQGGHLDISIDGDLFKIILSLKSIHP